MQNAAFKAGVVPLGFLPLGVMPHYLIGHDTQLLCDSKMLDYFPLSKRSCLNSRSKFIAVSGILRNEDNQSRYTSENSLPQCSIIFCFEFMISTSFSPDSNLFRWNGKLHVFPRVVLRWCFV